MKPPPLPPRRQYAAPPAQPPYPVAAPYPPYPQQQPPLPVMPLSYADTTTNPGKPGPLIALAICALVYCALSFFSNGITAFIWFAAYRDSVPPVVVAPAALPPATMPAYHGDLLGPEGLPAAQRKPIVDAAPITGPYAEDRKAMLDALLRDFGRDIAGPQGQLTLREQSQPATANPDRPQTFNCEVGEIIIANDSASLNSTRVGRHHVVGDHATNPYGQRRLRAGVLDEEIARLKSQHPGLSQRQVDFIADRFVALRSDQVFREPFVDVVGMGAAGVAQMQINRDHYWVLPDGRSALLKDAPQGLDARTGAPIPPPSNFKPKLPGSRPLMLTNAVHAILGFTLAIYLIVVAIRVLAGSAAAARGLLRFSWAKVLLIAMELTACIAYFASVTATASPGQRMVGNFNLDDGQRGLALSVVFQSIVVVAFMLTMYLSPSIRAYLTGHGGLGIASNTFKSRFAELRRSLRLPLLLAAAALLALGLWHVKSAPGTGVAAPQFAAGAVLMIALAAGCALLAFPIGSRAVVSAASILVLLFSACTTTAQQASSTGKGSPQYIALERRAKLLAARRTLTPEQIRELATMGAPAQETLLEWLKRRRFDEAALRIVAEEWRKSRLLEEKEPYDVAMKYLPQVEAAGRLHVYLEAFKPDPALAPYHARAAIKASREDRAKLIAKAVEMDKGAALLALASEKLADEKTNSTDRHAIYFALYHLGAAAEPVLLKALQRPDHFDKVYALQALQPGGPDWQKPDIYSSSAAPTALDSDVPDRPLSAQALAAVTKALRENDGQVREEAAHVLAFGGREARQALLDALTGQRELVSGHDVIRVALARRYPLLRPFVRQHSHWSKEDSMVYVQVVQSLMQEKRNVADMLVMMLDGPARATAAELIAEAGVTEKAHLARVASAAVSQRGRIGTLLIKGLYRGEFAGDPQVISATRQLLNSTDHSTRFDTARTLVETGAAGRKRLIELLADESATTEAAEASLAALIGHNKGAFHPSQRGRQGRLIGLDYRRGLAKILTAFETDEATGITVRLKSLDSDKPGEAEAAADSFGSSTSIGPVTRAKLNRFAEQQRPQINMPMPTPPPVAQAASESAGGLLWTLTWAALAAVCVATAALAWRARFTA